MLRSGRFPLLCAAIFVCTLSAPVWAAPSSGADWSPGRCPASSDPVVKFTLRSGEVRHNSDWLSLAIYADGCVWSHRPLFLIEPGDRFRRLGANELNELLNVLDGAFSFDAESTRRAADEIERGHEESQRGSAPHVLMAAEGAPQAVFELNLSAALREAHGLGGTAGRRSFSWTGLGFDARRYPEIPALANLERAQRRLLDLGRSGLRRPGEAQP